MKKVILYITVLTLIAMFTGCAQPPGSDGTEPETKEIKYETVSKDDLGSETVEKIESVKHKKGYMLLTEDEEYAYLFIGSGEKPTGGYDIKIKSVTQTGDKTLISVEEISPGKDDMVTEALTYPYIIVKIGKEALKSFEIKISGEEDMEEIDIEEFDIIGKIVSIDRTGEHTVIMVEGDITQWSSYDKASISIDENTLITVNEKQVDAGSLYIGMRIAVVFEGPVAESYPVQAYAAEISGDNDPGNILPYEIVAGEEESLQYIKTHRGFGIIREDEEYYYIFIGAGEKNTGGYDIRVTDVVKTGDEITILVAEESPGKDDMVMQVITYPYQIIRISKDYGKNYSVINEEGEIFEDMNDEKI
jgi:hypothetical protein